MDQASSSSPFSDTYDRFILIPQDSSSPEASDTQPTSASSESQQHGFAHHSGSAEVGNGCFPFPTVNNQMEPSHSNIDPNLHMERVYSADARASSPRIPANHEIVDTSANINNQADVSNGIEPSFVCNWSGCKNRLHRTEWRLRIHHLKKHAPDTPMYCWIEGCNRHKDQRWEDRPGVTWPFPTVGSFRAHMKLVHGFDTSPRFGRG